MLMGTERSLVKSFLKSIKRRGFPDVFPQKMGKTKKPDTRPIWNRNRVPYFGDVGIEQYRCLVDHTNIKPHSLLQTAPLFSIISLDSPHELIMPDQHAGETDHIRH